MHPRVDEESIEIDEDKGNRLVECVGLSERDEEQDEDNNNDDGDEGVNEEEEDEEEEDDDDEEAASDSLFSKVMRKINDANSS
jgi:hypothetical protein